MRTDPETAGPDNGSALVRNLEKQAESYGVYAGLLAEQRQALLHGDLQGLAQANASIDAAVSELLRLEVDREALVRALTAPEKTRFDAEWITRPAAPAPAVKCEELAARLAPDTGRALLAARERLRGVVENVQRAASINAALAGNGERMIAATMASLTTLAGQGTARHQTYSRDGQARNASGRRQIRNLLNRSA